MTEQGDNGAAGCPCQGSNVYENSFYAKLPGAVLRPGGLILTRRIIDYCAFARGAKVVDVGCGAGITVEYLRAVCRLDAVGVDVSETLLKQARERAPDLPLIQAAGEKLPFADSSVAGVLAECSLSVMPDAGRVLAESSRILVSGGKLALTDLYVWDTDSISPIGARPGTGGVSGIITYEQLAKLLTDNDFTILAWEDQSSFLKEFVACFIMEYGSTERLWQCITTRLNNRRVSRPAKLGYFLLVAEKRRMQKNYLTEG